MWLLVGSVAYWVERDVLPDGASGWVQALGALLAVAVAIAVPAWQKQHEMQAAALDDRRKRVDRVHAVLSLTQDLLTHFESAERGLRNGGTAFEDRRAKAIQLLARTSRSYIDLDLLAFGNEMVSYVLYIKSAALYTDQIASETRQFAFQYDPVRDELRKKIRGLKKQGEALIDYSDALES